MASARLPRGDTPSGATGARSMSCSDFARLARMPASAIERECEVRAFRASGPGGQGVNTTDSAVRMRHVPTGLVVTSRTSRSQHRNRQECLEKLRREFERRSVPPAARVKTRVSAAQKRKRLEAKRRQSSKKALRRRVGTDS